MAPTPKPITISGSSRTRSDCSGMRSGCSGERKCRGYGSSHSPGLKSGTFERAAPTAADPKEKLPSASVERCFGNGSPSRTGEWESCSEAFLSIVSDGTFPRASDCEIPTCVSFPDLSVGLGDPGNSHRCRIPRPEASRRSHVKDMQQHCSGCNGERTPRVSHCHRRYEVPGTALNTSPDISQHTPTIQL